VHQKQPEPKVAVSIPDCFSIFVVCLFFWASRLPLKSNDTNKHTVATRYTRLWYGSALPEGDRRFMIFLKRLNYRVKRLFLISFFQGKKFMK